MKLGLSEVFFIVILAICIVSPEKAKALLKGVVETLKNVKSATAGAKENLNEIKEPLDEIKEPINELKKEAAEFKDTFSLK